MVDFPSNPTEGQTHAEEGNVWVYFNGAWVVGTSIPSMIETDLYDEGNGYTIIGNTLIQWGEAGPTNASGEYTLTFNKAWGNADYRLTANVNVGAGSAGPDRTVSVGTRTTTTCDLRISVDGSPSNSVTAFWVAIGTPASGDEMPTKVMGVNADDYVSKIATGEEKMAGSLRINTDLTIEHGAKNENGTMHLQSNGNSGAYTFWDEGWGGFRLNIYNSSGVYLRTAFSFHRDGNITFTGNSQFAGNTIAIENAVGANTHLYFRQNGLDRVLLYQQDGTEVFHINHYDSGGVANGNTNFSVQNGRARVTSGDMVANGIYYGNGGNFCAFIQNSIGTTTFLQDVHYMGWAANGSSPTGISWNAANAVNTVLGVCYADTWSDPRLKKDIRDSDIDALQILNDIPVVSFDWNDTGKRRFGWRPEGDPEPDWSNGREFNRVVAGFISTDVKHYIPEAVAEHGDPENGHDMYENIDTKQMIPYLVRAIQQLTERVKELEEGA